MELINWNDLKFWLLLVWWIVMVWIIAMNLVSKTVAESGRDKERWVTYSILFTPLLTGIMLFISENLLFKKKSNSKMNRKFVIKKSYKNIGIVTFIYSITALISAMFAYLNNNLDLSLGGIVFSFISLCVGIYIFYKIRELINEVYEKTIVNVVISLCIVMEVVVYFSKLYMYVYHIDVRESSLYLFLGVLLSIGYGIIGIIYGRGIKRVTADSDFKMYGNLLIISSIFMVTGLGYFIAGILNAVAYFYLSIIFKNSDRVMFEKKKNSKENQVKNEEALKYFDKLTLEEYEVIKDEAIMYLPKELSEEDKKSAILKHIAKKYIV